MVVVAEWFVRGFVMRPLSECGCCQPAIVVGVRLLLSECGSCRVCVVRELPVWLLSE